MQNQSAPVALFQLSSSFPIALYSLSTVCLIPIDTLRSIYNKQQCTQTRQQHRTSRSKKTQARPSASSHAGSRPTACDARREECLVGIRPTTARPVSTRSLRRVHGATTTSAHRARPLWQSLPRFTARGAVLGRSRGRQSTIVPA